MTFISQYQVDTLKGKIISDPSLLGKIYKSKKNKYIIINVDHSLVDEYIKKGWEEYTKPLKTKTPLRIMKTTSKSFEDAIWCQFYELGFRQLNYDDNFNLPFSKSEEDKKQIDIVAINDEVIFLIECKTSEYGNRQSYKDQFDLLGIRLDGFRKSLEQVFGKRRVKFIFATKNFVLDENSLDLERLKKTNSFYYNDNTYEYVNSLLKNYKNAALYQFLGLTFKNEIVSDQKIEVPAVEGKMGGKNYYMFSIEPSLLLKISFVLHRTRANEAEFPTYQRLLVPSRLNGITKYIDKGGYFPNSLIINFSQEKHQLQFESSARGTTSNSRFGTLKIPNAYAIAYVIDGQHRLYGYANSQFLDSNTIPVVAFDNLSTKEQLDIFMDINQNQKAVSPSLKTDLEEDLFWNSNRADMRLKALRSSIIKGLCNTLHGPLQNKVTVGEDKALLSTEFFKRGLIDSKLLPWANGNKFDEERSSSSLYNIHNHDHDQEMKKTKKEVVNLINSCYQLIHDDYPEVFNREKYFIMSNRGSYAVTTLIGHLNQFLTNNKIISKSTSSKERFVAISPYITAMLDEMQKISSTEESKILSIQGQGAEVSWLRFFQSLINTKIPDYNPKELQDWRERQDEALQDKGRKFGVEIEKKMKSVVLNKMKILYGDNWELEINAIKTACQARANEENEKNYKEGLDKRVDWTEMFNINDYKKIIENYWTKTPEHLSGSFTSFQDEFSINIGEGFNSKPERIKWISRFNSYRNMWAHEGTKEKRLNRNEVDFLEKIHSHFYS